jgi:hypothetical protein
VQELLLLFFRLLLECAAVNMIALIQGAIRISLVHVRKIAAHLLRREHVCVCDAEGFKDVLLEIVVQLQSRRPLYDDAGPVNACL